MLETLTNHYNQCSADCRDINMLVPNSSDSSNQRGRDMQKYKRGKGATRNCASTKV